MTEAIATLRTLVLSGVAWAAATRFLGQMLNWSITLVVLRLLHPSDYGLMALTMAAVGFLQSMSYAGFADAIVQARDIDRIGLRQAFGLVLLLHAGFIAALWLAARPIAAFYQTPELVPLLHVASLVFVPLTFATMSRTHLQQKLALKQSSRAEMAASLVAGVVTLAMAWAGAGVWALLAGFLTNQTVVSLGYYILAPYAYLPSFSRGGHSSRLLRFGSWRVAEHVLWYLSTQVDIFLIARIFGTYELSLYSAARTLASMPVDKLALVVKPVSFPAFSQLQQDRARAYGYLARGMGILAFVAFPVLFGLAAIAPLFVSVVLGQRWLGATSVLAVLALGTALRPVGMLMSPFLMGLGEVRASFFNALMGLLLLCVAYAIGSHWGLVGVCSGGAIAYAIQFCFLTHRAAHVCARPVSELWLSLLRPFFAAIVMASSVVGARELLNARISNFMELTSLVLLGVAVYTLVALVVCRSLIVELRTFIHR